MVAIEINEGSLMIAAAGAMASAFVTLIFCYLAFRVSLESRLKDLEHQVENLLDLEEAFIAQEERIRDLEMMTSNPEARSRSTEDGRIIPEMNSSPSAK